MHRESLLRALKRFEDRYPEDGVRSTAIAAFVRRRKDCFLRCCLEGHITASSWVLSPDGQRFLLVHHKKLGAWLQPGGHADGEPDTLKVALNEAREESGLDDFEIVGQRDGEQSPFDVDVHAIPENDGVAEHLHYDIRYLLRASKDGPLKVSEESHDVRWFGWGEAAALLEEESLRRMAARARRFVAEGIV